MISKLLTKSRFKSSIRIKSIISDKNPSFHSSMDSSKKTIRFVCVSDTHGLTEKIEVPDGDVLIHAGDFSNMGEPEIVQEFNDWLGSLPHPTKIVIAGNHDMTFDLENWDKLNERFFGNNSTIDPKKTKALLTNCIYLEDSATEVHGYKVWGSPWSPWFFDWGFNAHRGDQCKRIADMIPEDTEILITHGPPHGVLDQVPSGEHVGCTDLAEKVKKIKPLVHVFGHIHEGYGVESIGGVTYVNASICTLNYKLTNKPVIVDLSVKARKK